MGVLRRLMHLAALKFHQPAARKKSRLPPHLAPPIAGTIDSRLPQPPPRNPSNVAPSQEQQDQVEEEGEDFSFEIDWSVFTMAHIQTTIQDMLLTLVGLPIPNQQQSHAFTVHNGHWRTNLDVHHLYDLRQGSDTKFLVRGVIYDMAALAISPVEREKRLKEIAASGSKDWSNLVHESVSEAFGKVEAVSAEQVVDTLGLKNVDGLKDRIAGAATTSVAALRKKKLQEKQSLEEILGRGDSIRAKYADRLRHKQALAEARKEHEKLITTSPGENDNSVLPGCPALIRYLEERGISQALLARGPDSELRSLMNQLGGFRFREVRRLQEESLTEGMLSAICTKWELPSKEVLLVVGANGESDEMLKIVADRGYFICRVQSREEPKTPTKDSQKQQAGIASWFHQLAEGTLHIQDKPDFENDQVHFRVTDMTELKWVIEDLNGVSYRTSTMIRGFK